jgi:hypothetical protein
MDNVSASIHGRSVISTDGITTGSTMAPRCVAMRIARFAKGNGSLPRTRMILLIPTSIRFTVI